MCLYVDKAQTKQFVYRRRQRDYIIGYKVVTLYGNVLSSPLYSHTWKPGLNRSNTRRKGVCFREFTEISRCIHVFLKKEAAVEMKKRYPFSRVIIPVKCYIKNFIAKQNKCAAFTEVHLTKKAYRKALRRS